MSKNCVPLLSPTRALQQPSFTIDSVSALWCSARWHLQHLAAGLGRYWLVGLLQLTMLPLQDHLSKLSICCSVLPSRLLGNLPCKLL